MAWGGGKADQAESYMVGKRNDLVRAQICNFQFKGTVLDEREVMWYKCLPHKLEDLSSAHRTLVFLKNGYITRHMLVIPDGETETVESLGTHQPARQDSRVRPWEM